MSINEISRDEILKNIKFRMAEISDAEELLKIYAPYVTDTVITFEYDVPSIEEFRDRVKHTLEGYPYVVCTYEDKILGYAYAHRYGERAAYQWDVELSIYLDMNYKGLGLGSLLYNKVIEIVKLQNVQNIYACITSANEKSLKFHEKCGFEFIGVFKDTGYKFDEWYDITWLGMRTKDKTQKPEPLKMINEVDARLIENILDEDLLHIN
ncbi:MAG: GNAT family N-acetyltransferase [Intestinibacter bartlettii]|uniref:GNAT family N-acetyltransferase n=1 Tax=Intestinibacter bartlettii TaxID=261299 RepID=UPI0026F19EC2|nr:GNAT family N-acetyltransferase [Intestinibacter bartlettii]MDO5009700.1 GNAT family N-acetyltransferase [Intestinibacter bartlettii]